MWLTGGTDIGGLMDWRGTVVSGVSGCWLVASGSVGRPDSVGLVGCRGWWRRSGGWIPVGVGSLQSGCRWVGFVF